MCGLPSRQAVTVHLIASKRRLSNSNARWCLNCEWFLEAIMQRIACSITSVGIASLSILLPPSYLSIKSFKLTIDLIKLSFSTLPALPRIELAKLFNICLPAKQRPPIKSKALACLTVQIASIKTTVTLLTWIDDPQSIKTIGRVIWLTVSHVQNRSRRRSIIRCR